MIIIVVLVGMLSAIIGNIVGDKIGYEQGYQQALDTVQGILNYQLKLDTLHLTRIKFNDTTYFDLSNNPTYYRKK